MSQLQPLAALGGLLLGGALLGGLLWWQSGLQPATRTDDWRPPCVQRLGKAYAEFGPASRPDDRPARNIVFGVDRSGSNGELADVQLDAAVAYAATLEPESGVGVLLITDRSDRSTTPDMPFEPGEFGARWASEPVLCPGCKPDSLFQQKCVEQLEAAQTLRVAELNGVEEARRTRLQEERAVRIHGWRDQAAAYTPRPGTSLLAFFTKLADLPPVRREPQRTTVVVLSDLEASQAGERKQLDKFERAYRSSGTCPEASWLPKGLVGLEIALVQSVRDGIDADLWARRWDAVLTCAGAHVRRHRYSTAVPLRQLLDEPGGPALALAE
ncbi:hypothetical protein [Nannocystis pusilla]|uniref:VWA domain-containing protein n=1 Tax=Nannocystis pusilla TaxID=889268 RepID=A0ABS7TSH9_9BACT|nr:hypothetical protein [Nannocystis pusilla]MBZ5711171.1 hypothetical protein [Nannocystis pusilla]